MDHRINATAAGIGAAAEYPPQAARIAQVAGHQLQAPATEFLHPFQGLGGTVAEVVEHHQLVAGLQQQHTGVAADETSTAGDKQFGHGMSYSLGSILAGWGG